MEKGEERVAESVQPQAQSQGGVGGAGGAPSRSPEWGLAAGHGGANWHRLGGSMLAPHARDSLFFNQHPSHPPTPCALPKGSITEIVSWMTPGPPWGSEGGSPSPTSPCCLPVLSNSGAGQEIKGGRGLHACDLGPSSDSLTSVSPIYTVKGGMPDSMRVHNNSGSWNPLKLHNANDAHSPDPGRASHAHSTPRAHSLTYSQDGRGRKEAAGSRANLRTPELRPSEAPLSLFLGPEVCCVCFSTWLGPSEPLWHCI